MSIGKKFNVIRTKTGEELEQFASLEAAEKFLILMQGKGEHVSVKTVGEEPETPDDFDIEGLEIDEPTVEFGDDLGYFDEDSDVEIDSGDEPDFVIDD